MQKNIMRKAAGYLKRARRHRRRLKLENVLWCVVVFWTVYALILPSVTMEKRGCGLPEHTHTAACYSTPQTPEVHTHTDECYIMEQGELICTETTGSAHTHGAECYQETETLVCDIPESECHRHGEGCYDKKGELICTDGEPDGHRHGPE